MKITGTFLDEISHDIPSANWGELEWARDFDAMKSVGIDTVIMIRCGYKDKMTFESTTINKYQKVRPVYIDLVDLFLSQAERCNMDFYFGMYDSGIHWHEGNFSKEIEINNRLAEEVAIKYGHRKAFKGWYASHEIHAYNEGQIQLLSDISETLKKIKNGPILMSPYIKGRMQFDKPISAVEHSNQWDLIFSMLSGKVDCVAFQDGQVAVNELEEFTLLNKALADKYSITAWANIETFERGMPINFLPIDWRTLKFKMDVATRAGVSKLITFEFSHFMSPHSMYPSAHHLFNRYKEMIL